MLGLIVEILQLLLFTEFQPNYGPSSKYCSCRHKQVTEFQRNEFDAVRSFILVECKTEKPKYAFILWLKEAQTTIDGIFANENRGLCHSKVELSRKAMIN